MKNSKNLLQHCIKEIVKKMNNFCKEKVNLLDMNNIDNKLMIIQNYSIKVSGKPLAHSFI